MKTAVDLKNDSIPSLVLRLAVPAMIAQFVNILYSIIDRIYIGHIRNIGGLALAGVGVCGPIITLLSSFGTLIGIGGSILMSIRMGEKKMKTASQILSNSFLLLCVFSLTLTVIFLLFKDNLLMWFGVSEITFVYADTYMTIYTAGTFFALMAAGLNYFINCQGFPLAGMAAVLIGAVSNILLDPLFIFVFHMGVAGAAIATVISQMLYCFFALSFLFSKKVPVRISFGGYSWNIFRHILYLGLSPFLIMATDSIILIVMNTVLQRYGGPPRVIC
ncbi:MAG: MATE family efflux transporter [Ruminococcus sp.]|jgi:Na+-driven multidrug efflux pump